MKTLIFAYGSNMKTERMVKRVPGAKVIGRVFAGNRKMVCNKKSKDGSGKANLVETPGSVTWGVLYEVEDENLERLDRIEGGYERVLLAVTADDDTRLIAQAYVSDQLTADPRPFRWYKELVLDGAREHNLPPGYIEDLEEIEPRDS